ncbi:hypothetical protein PFMALIP_05356 [Plasmodium falciparum MaliPS096_E11]|uniref:Syntaxin 6/10/61 N-terminal domain-containing protein n=1 Tax=Plasmodium falciparum MaliPS096_E11 TaxID=1036727 RepID=A0A024WIE7_PLAFA|nr:hypothetical protein PFMALIP_05356 [Plasmodium falciparum MaliPS096_E11]
MNEQIDPFYEAKQEVDISVNKLQSLYNNWNNIPDKSSISAREKYNLIKEEIKYLNEDLNDLDNSVNIVKKNSYKFNISSQEIEERTQSLRIIRNLLNEITNNINNNVLSYNNNTNNDYNSVILKRQDNDLEELAESAERLHHAAITINTELKDQQKLVNIFSFLFFSFFFFFFFFLLLIFFFFFFFFFFDF